MKEQIFNRAMGEAAERDWVEGLEEDEQDDLGTINRKIEEVVADLSGAYKKEEVIRLSERLLDYYKKNGLGEDISDPELAADVQRAIRTVQAERRRKERESQAQISQIQNEMNQAGDSEKRSVAVNEGKGIVAGEKKSGFMSGVKNFFSR